MVKIRSRRALLLRRYINDRMCRMYKLLVLLLTSLLWLSQPGPVHAKQSNQPLSAEQYLEEHRKFWDKAYSKKGYFIGTEPDEFFAAELSKLRPGRLLLPGEGEGRNAVHAAGTGWYVDAFDFSTKGRDKALRLAKTRGVSFNYLLKDFSNPNLPDNAYDVVAIIDLPTMPNIRAKGFTAVRKSLRRGGVVIYEGYAPRPGEQFWASPDELKNAFAGFKFKMLTTHNAIRHHEGKEHIDLVVQMVAVK